jgi:hypothetical protein
MKVEIVILLFGGLVNLTAICFLLATISILSAAYNSLKICYVNNEIANSMPGYAERTDDLSFFYPSYIKQLDF